ncbi:MAG: hypothetical protein JW726_07770 [Anaerolineales bacterium]|nr:hypothetical protein [Anaerolineales bacterium]
MSVTAALIVLTFTMARYIEFPVQEFGVQLPGIYLSITISVRTVTSLLAAGLTAASADWLLQDHPALQGKHAFQSVILPALTALVISVPLNQVSMGLSWWLGLGAGGLLLILVLIGEYIVLDPENERHPLAVAGLSAVSFALFLVLAATLRSAEVRLVMILPALTIAAWLVSMRTLHLRLHGEWAVYESAIIALIVGQICAAAHYWPLSSISYGLLVLGPAYALVSLINGMIEDKSWRQLIWEPCLALMVAWVVAILAR